MTHLQGDELAVFSEISGHLKVIARDFSQSPPFQVSSCIFLPCSRHLVGMQLRKKFEVSSRSNRVMCVF